jgi:hypothetical protein
MALMLEVGPIKASEGQLAGGSGCEAGGSAFKVSIYGYVGSQRSTVI